jgi:hypothetical protein
MAPSLKECVMKKLLFLTLVILLTSVIGGNVSIADEIFWDRDKLPDATVTDKDFKLKYGNPNIKSFGDQEIYDIEKTFSEEKPPEAYVPPEAPESREPVARPPRQESAPPRARTPEPSSRRMDVAPRAREVSPQPAETSPETPPAVTQPWEQPRPRAQEPEKPVTTSPPAAEPSQATTGSKKMKWGMDSQPAEQKSEEKPKFQWGR